MKLRRILACMMALLLVCSLPLAAFAEEYDLANGSISVTANGDGQYVTQEANNIKDEKQTTDTVIKQTGSETSTTNTVTITAAADTTANVTLDGVNIDTSTSGGAAIQTSGGGDVVIELDGTNKVQSGREHAGVEKTNGGDLTITNTDEITADDPGSLEATGGRSGAGIGAGYAHRSGNIVVSGNAQVKAQGGVSYFDTRHTASYGAGAAIGNGGGGSLTDLDESASLTGEEANVTVDAPEEGTGFGLYVGQLDQGWIAKYQPGADLDTDTPSSLTYQGKDGNITTSTDVQLATDKAPTCTEDGHKGGFQVGDDLVGAEILNSPPHDPEHHDAKAPTCEEVGWDSYDTCKRDGCTYSTYVEKNVLGHSFTNYVSNNDATYAKDGTRTAKCDHPGCDATDTITDPGTRLPVPLYRVIGEEGQGVSCETERTDGVLTITVDADVASLTGYLGGIQALHAQGVDTIVFVTNGAASTFTLADLLATMTAGDSYTLTHDGSTVTFTLSNGTDISGILK